MAIKSGSIVHYGNGFLVRGLQTGGADSINVNRTKVYELGNHETIADVRDTPELTYGLESLDMTTTIEAILTGVDPDDVDEGDEFDFANAKPVDIISPWTSDVAPFTATQGVAIPYLTLENVTYRFGVRQNATQQFSLRGDSIFYVPGTPYYQEFNAAGAGPYVFAHTAIAATEDGADLFALCVTLLHTDGSYTRLFLGEDYTNTAGGFTLSAVPAGSDVIQVIYGSAVSANFPQSIHILDNDEPAAVRARNIKVWLSDGAATPTLVRLRGVQSIEATRRVTLENEEELGNSHYTATGYDVPEVSGTLTVRPPSRQYLMDLLHQMTGVASNRIVSALDEMPLELLIQINHPTTGDPVKSIVVDDAILTVPATQGRVTQKLEVQIPYTSVGGHMKVYAGEAP